MKVTLQQGRRYMATIRLGFLEGMASNETIADKLRRAGFIDVEVNGSGRNRVAKGRWPLSTATAELPSQITSTTEL